jgi:DNA polymerase I-like protein with 3'-5' exonuclease and polymerase domains
VTRTVAFDVETDGFLDVLTRVHCLVIRDMDTGEVWSCTDNWTEGDFIGEDGSVLTHRLGIRQGLHILSAASRVIGHNIIGFDIPAIQKVYPDFTLSGDVRDTLVMARVIWPRDRLKEMDYRGFNRGTFPGKLIGNHSLEAFGYRLGEYKGDFKGPWETWTPEMQEYCEQDVEVTARLWAKVQAQRWPEQSTDLEHRVARIISRQERRGFTFDMEAARRLYADLVDRKAQLEAELTAVFPPLEVRTTIIPKVNNSKLGYVKGVPAVKVRIEDFNPSSRDQIAKRLQMLGWTPTEFTAGGKPQVDETTLSDLPYPEAKPLLEYLLVDKRIGQIATGDESWMKHVARDGRIRGSVNSNGAVTGRMTHARPNLAQVPASHSPWGEQCRSVFVAASGMTLVGCDADALELRCLAHFMARYDDGAYVRVVLEGKKEDGTDIHSVNARALGLEPQAIAFGTLKGRDVAKTWFYAFIYGAGDEKLGLILGHPRGPAAMKAGKRSRARFLTNLPALGKLTEAVKEAATVRKHLKGLDGRLLFVRSAHSALNTLLQSAGALVMKKALVLLDAELIASGAKPGFHYEFVANVHDEWQIEALPECAEEVGKVAAWSIEQAGVEFGFRCPLAGQFKLGRSWADTH